MKGTFMTGEAKYWRDKWKEAQKTIQVLMEQLKEMVLKLPKTRFKAGK